MDESVKVKGGWSRPCTSEVKFYSSGRWAQGTCLGKRPGGERNRRRRRWSLLAHHVRVQAVPHFLPGEWNWIDLPLTKLVRQFNCGHFFAVQVRSLEGCRSVRLHHGRGSSRCILLLRGHFGTIYDFFGAWLTLLRAPPIRPLHYRHSHSHSLSEHFS